MKVLICGSRGWHDPEPIETIIAGYDIIAEGANQKLTVIQGGARGADAIAKSLAKSWGAEIITEEANWNKYGKGAGPIRNKKMLEDHNPDVVWAFRTTGKSNGTDDMVKQAKARGIPTFVVVADGEDEEE